MTVKPITYKVPTFTPDGSGGTTESYLPEAVKDWAEVENLNNRMEVVALQSVDGTLMQFKVRWRPSLLITDKWLIGYEGKDHKITGISKVKEREFYL